MFKKEWYKEWFNENYLHLYSHRDDVDADMQLDLIEKSIPLGITDSILDLCCGEGRHTVLLLERGYRVTGMDLSETLLNSGRKKYGDIPIIRGDMRNIPGKFDLILSLFTSFGYFETYEENASVLRGVNKALNDGGYFWLDFFNSTYVERNLVPGSERYLDNGTHVSEKRAIVDGRVSKRIRLLDQEGIESVYHESVSLLSRRELVCMMEDAGFEVLHQFGDYTGSPWSSEMPRTILSCRKTVK